MVFDKDGKTIGRIEDEGHRIAVYGRNGEFFGYQSQRS